MAHDHNHDHPDHDPGHDHHGHGHALDVQPPIPGVAQPAEDAASKSLADALHLSFRLLSLIMVLVLVALMLTGISQIQPSERGIKLLFGAIQGEGRNRVLPEGLSWSWPEPLGKVEKIPIDQRKLEIRDFWFRSSNSKDMQKLSEMTVSDSALKPGYDGALFTADRSLVHVMLTCQYRVATGEGGTDPLDVVNYLSNVSDGEEMVHSAVCSAAIHAAGTRTADYILNNKEEFSNAVRTAAQAQLSAGGTGLRIQAVQVDATTVPLGVIPAQNDVTASRQEANTAVSIARSEAVSILNQTAGTNWKALVGDPDNPAELGQLQQYAMLREKGDADGAAKMLEQIDATLVNSGGIVSQIVNEAKAASEIQRQQVASRVQNFRQLVDYFHQTPELMLARLWADTKQDVFASKLLEKFYITPSQQKTIVNINRDPSVRKAMETTRLENAKNQRPGQ